MKEILERLVKFVEDKGGARVVFKKIGKSPQSFYNYTNRGSLPNMEILALISNEYEDFDANFILKGTPSQNEDAEKLTQLQSENKVLHMMYENALRDKYSLPGKTKVAIKSSDALPRHMKLACEKVTKRASRNRIGLLPGRYNYGNVTRRQSGL